MIRPVDRFVEWYCMLTISRSSLWFDLERFPGEEGFCFRSDDSNSLLNLGGEQDESYSLLPKDDEGWEESIFCLENIASMPSFRFVMGSIKLADSVPTLPTSLGT